VAAVEDERAIKAEMRLWALEALVCNVVAVILASDPDPQELLARTRRQMIEGAKQRTFEGFDAAQSDLFSAELEAAVARLMDMVAAQMHRGRA
jgi:hypothetical protein